MSTKRVSGSRKRPPRRAPAGRSSRINLPSSRFYGVSLAGGKSEKTCVAALDFYMDHQKLFLSRIDEQVASDGEVSGDAALLEILHAKDQVVHSVAFDVPLTVPLCFDCKLKCPGVELCHEPHVTWMWKHFRRKKRKKKTARLFTPYTERSVEMYINDELEEPFSLQNALGANLAPLTARARYLLRRLKHPALEVNPKVTIWRLGNHHKLTKHLLRSHRNSLEGSKSREAFLKALSESQTLFMYQQDVFKMIEQPQAFDAFICALTGYLAAQGKCERRPADFPKKEGWISIPKK